MSSILDINSGSSDSEDDQDYVPPNTAVSDESEDEISEGEEYECSGAPTPKKIKLEEKIEPSIDKQTTESIWKNFLKGVDSSYNGGQKKAVSSGLNLSHQSESDSSDLSISSTQEREGQTSDMEKSTCEMTIPEKEIISENVVKSETVISDVTTSAREKIVPIEKSITANKSISTKVKPVAAVEINASKAGLTSILGVIANKDKKMTVLEKSMLDWRNYKKEEGIEENLANYNRGRHGYIERKRFLERSDLRLFESEKSARLSGRKK